MRVRAVAVAAAVACAAGATAAAGSPLVPACAAAPGVNDRCEAWAYELSDNTPREDSISDVPVGMAVTRRGDVSYVASTSVVDGATNESHITVAAVSLRNSGAARWFAHPATELPTEAAAIALSPDERQVVVAGTVTYRTSLSAPPRTQWHVSAYETAAGRPRWTVVRALGGDANVPVGMVMSPRGDRVYVVGYSQFNGSAPYVEYVTISYDLRTGRQLWVARFAGTAGGANTPVGIAVSPRGDRVYVTGATEHLTASPTRVFDIGTIAYDTRDGRQAWRAITRAGSSTIPSGLALSPAGDRLYVVGRTTTGSGSATVTRGLTVALSTGRGTQSWLAHLDPQSDQLARATAVTVSPKGDRVYVAGGMGREVARVNNGPGATVGSAMFAAYDARTGVLAWQHSYAPAADYATTASRIATDASGSTVYAAGTIGPPPGAVAYPLTLAYRASDGTLLWSSRYDVREPTGAGTPSQSRGVAGVGLAVTKDLVADLYAYQPVARTKEAIGCATESVAVGCSDAQSVSLVLGYAP